MSCSVIYTVSEDKKEISAGNLIPFGDTIRRYGQNIKLGGSNDRIYLAGRGYYLISIVIACDEPKHLEAVNPAVLEIRQDGMALPGGTLDVASKTVRHITLQTVARVTDSGTSVIDLIVKSEAIAIEKINVQIEKK